MIDKKRIEKAVREILIAIGENPDREGLKETPRRVADAYEEIFSGYYVKPEVKKFERYGNLVALKNVEFFSMCEHHILPFYGRVSVIYEPGDKVLGISKIARIVAMYSRRLQIQERMTQQIGEEVLKNGAKGVIVIAEGKHMCMMMRGAKTKGVMKTIWSGGTLKENEKDLVTLMGFRKRGKRNEEI
jgi:GTP cyclohydrolase I